MSRAFLDWRVEAGVAGLATAFAVGRTTPEEVLLAYLERIARLNPMLNAFIDVDEAGARVAAAAATDRWRRGAAHSPIDGCVVGVKSNIAVQALPWTAGVGAYRDRIAREDAACVARLRAAGAVIIGTLNMEEGALGAVTDNPWFGRTENPWRAGFTPGGSSGGSATATAAGLCAAALGTDTMGSVRIPSAYCGVFGIKPAFGAVSMTGVTPLSPSLDHVGVHARSAEDAALVLAAISDGEAASVEGPLAVLDLVDQIAVSDSTRQAFADLVERARDLGVATPSQVRLDLDYGRLRRRGLLIAETEGLAEHGRVLDQNPDGFSPAFAGALRWGGDQSPEKLAEARAELTGGRVKVAAALTERAGMLAPTTGAPAFAFGDAIPADQADITCLANAAGVPAVAFPIGLDAGGLPLSAQIIGHNSTAILRLAALLATPCGAPPMVAG